MQLSLCHGDKNNIPNQNILLINKKQQFTHYFFLKIFFFFLTFDRIIFINLSEISSILIFL